jgi:hypothetical protein
MAGKLTLSVDPEVVRAAKRYAAEGGTSVSRLVEGFLAAVSSEPTASTEPPILRRLRGSLSEGDIGDHRDYLVDKYS